jgi:hypothetical protein
MWFSTGDSVVPTRIDGAARLGEKEPAVDATITATGSDSVLVWKVPSDGNGVFIMPGLDPGAWRLEAFVDLDGDGQYRFGAEPWDEDTLILTQDSTVTLTLNLAVVDTSPPVVYEAVAVHRSHVRLVFSEPMFGLSDTSFSLVDTTGQRYAVATAYASFLDPAIVHLYLTDAMRDDQMELSVSDGQDSVGLSLADTTLTFLGTSLSDTLPPVVQNLFYADDAPFQVSVAFSEAVRAETVDSALAISELPGCRPLAGATTWFDPSLVSWTAADSLERNGRYLFSLDDTVADFEGLTLRRPMVSLVPSISDTLPLSWVRRALVRPVAPDSGRLDQLAPVDSS